MNLYVPFQNEVHHYSWCCKEVQTWNARRCIFNVIVHWNHLRYGPASLPKAITAPFRHLYELHRDTHLPYTPTLLINISFSSYQSPNTHLTPHHTFPFISNGRCKKIRLRNKNKSQKNVLTFFIRLWGGDPLLRYSLNQGLMVYIPLI